MLYFGLVAGILIIFAAVRFRFHLGMAGLAGGVILALTGTGFARVLWRSFQGTVLEPRGYQLLLAIALISALGSTMRVSGAMEKLARAIRVLFGDSRLVTVLLPSFIAFFSVPGASVFSAPLVDSVGDEIKMTPEQKALANVMFRHLWYYIYPVYPPFILIQQMTGLPYTVVFLPGMVAAVITFVTVYLLSFRHTLGKKAITKADAQGTVISTTVRNQALADLTQAAAPIMVILVLVIAAGINFPLALLAGIVTALMVAPRAAGYRDEVLRRLKEGVLPGVDWQIVTVIGGIMFFSQAIIQSQAVVALTSVFPAGTSPLVLFTVVVPFLVSFITGSQHAAAGIGIPLLLPMIGTGIFEPVVLFYLFSLAGYLMSPAHICMLGTVQYLKSDFPRSWKLAVYSCLGVLAFGLVLTIWWS